MSPGLSEPEAPIPAAVSTSASASASASCSPPSVGVVVARVGIVISSGPIWGSPLIWLNVSSIRPVVAIDPHLGKCLIIEREAAEPEYNQRCRLIEFNRRHHRQAVGYGQGSRDIGDTSQAGIGRNQIDRDSLRSWAILGVPFSRWFPYSAKRERPPVAPSLIGAMGGRGRRRTKGRDST